MQIKISKNILMECVSIASEMSSKEPGTASHEVKVMASEDTVYIASLNLIGSQFFIGKIEGEGCEITEGGRVCIPGKPFREALSLLSGDEITLTSDGFATQISGGGKEELVLCGMDPKEWIEPPNMSAKTSFNIPISTIREMHSLMSFNCSKDQTKAPMTAILMEVFEDGSVQCTATDQQRISFYSCPAGTATDIEMGKFEGVIKIAFPADAAGLASGKMFSHIENVMSISVDSSKILMKTPTSRFCCSQETGAEKYPRMRDLLCDKKAFTFSVSRAELLRVSKLVNVVANKSVCKIDFDVDEGVVVMSGKGKINKSNRSKQSIEIKNFSGDQIEDREILVSSEDLSEAISVIKNEDVMIGLTITNNETIGPIMTIKQEDRWKHLIFPAREVE